MYACMQLQQERLLLQLHLQHGPVVQPSWRFHSIIIITIYFSVLMKSPKGKLILNSSLLYNVNVFPFLGVMHQKGTMITSRHTHSILLQPPHQPPSLKIQPLKFDDLNSVCTLRINFSVILVLAVLVYKNEQSYLPSLIRFR